MNLKPKASTIFLGLGLFLFFLFVQFPYKNLRGYIFGKIYSATRVLIVAEDLGPSFFGWPGVSLADVDITAPVGNGEIELSAKKLVIRAAPCGFFPPSLSLSVSMSKLKKGGDLYVKFCDTKSGARDAAQASDLDLSQIAISPLSEPLKGVLNLDGNLYLNKTELAKSSGSATLAIEKLKIPPQNLQGFLLPALDIGSLKSSIIVRNGTAEIQGFQFGGPGADLNGSISGDIRLGKDISSSFLNLTLRLQLSDSYRKNPQAAMLVSLLDSFRAKKEGDYAMKWSANIGDMSTNLMSAIPQKAAD